MAKTTVSTLPGPARSANVAAPADSWAIISDVVPAHIDSDDWVVIAGSDLRDVAAASSAGQAAEAVETSPGHSTSVATGSQRSASPAAEGGKEAVEHDALPAAARLTAANASEAVPALVKQILGLDQTRGVHRTVADAVAELVRVSPASASRLVSHVVASRSIFHLKVVLSAVAQAGTTGETGRVVVQGPATEAARMGFTCGVRTFVDYNWSDLNIKLLHRAARSRLEVRQLLWIEGNRRATAGPVTG